MNHTVDRAALSVSSALQYIGIGRTSLYRLIAEGKIDARKFGKKTLILRDSADRFLASLPREARKHMIVDKLKAARRHNGTALGMHKLASYCVSDDSKPLPQIQSDFLSARFGLDAARARLTAELAWGCRA